MWDFYLAYSEAGFATRYLDDWQFGITALRPEHPTRVTRRGPGSVPVGVTLDGTVSPDCHRRRAADQPPRRGLR